MNDKKTKYSVPSGIFSRSKEFLSLATKVGAKELKNRISPTNTLKLEQIRDLTESLSRLKGAAMKAGQMLSIEASEFLPPEALAILSKLQNKSDVFMPIEDVEFILKKELGEEKFALIENLSALPIAAASIGQVHSAIYKGDKVVFKIQYPGIADSIDSDIRILKRIANTFMVMSRKSDISLDALFDELKDEFKKESDYVNEAENIKAYQKILEPYPEYKVPNFYKELSTKLVLCMSHESGVPFKEWMEKEPTKELQMHFGQLFLNLYTVEFFDNRMVQTDPNYANFLINEESKQIVLLDFGAVKRYSEEFLAKYIKLIKSAVEKNASETVSMAEKMNLMSKEERTETKIAFYEMIRASLSAFDEDRQPLHFGDSDYYKKTAEASKKLMKLVEFSAPPHQLIFLHRKLSGVFNMLKKMDLAIDLGPFWTHVIEIDKKLNP